MKNNTLAHGVHVGIAMQILEHLHGHHGYKDCSEDYPKWIVASNSSSNIDLSESSQAPLTYMDLQVLCVIFFRDSGMMYFRGLHCCLVPTLNIFQAGGFLVCRTATLCTDTYGFSFIRSPSMLMLELMFQGPVFFF